MSKFTIHINAESVENPEVNAGTNQSIQKDSLPSVQLSGSILSPGSGNLTNVLWSVVTSPSGVVPLFNDLTILNPIVSNVIDTVGLYVFKLTASNSVGGVGSDSVEIEITAIPIPDISVDAGPPQLKPLVPNSGVQLVGTVIQEGSAPISVILWEAESIPLGSTVSFSDDSILSPDTSSFVIPGVYVFKITVTNGNGESDSDTVTITIGTVPSVNAGLDTSITQPEDQVLLQGYVADTDGTIDSILWEQVSGPAGVAIASPGTKLTWVSLPSIGVYVFKITAIDNDGFTNSDTVSITVEEALIPSLLVMTTSRPTPTGEGTIDFRNGTPGEVISLDFSLLDAVPGSSLFFGTGILVPIIDYPHPLRSGTATLDAQGQLSTSYTISGNVIGRIKITNRDSGLLIPVIDTTEIDNTSRIDYE